MGMPRPQFDDLSLELKKVFDPAKAKTWILVAKGVAPLPPPLLVSSWAYLIEDADPQLKAAAESSLVNYPETSLLTILESELEGWVLECLGYFFANKESVIEKVLLNEKTPNSFFIEFSKYCSEKFSVMISNNQERILESPQIILSLESNPHHLKSNTDRIRHFLKLAGVMIPGEGNQSQVDDQVEMMVDESFFLSAIDGLDDEAKEKALLSGKGSLSDDQRQSLLQYIQKLNVGAKVKLAVKGNKEARSFLIRDTNKVVALAVLKSPRITDSEIAIYASMRNVSDDVIRVIATNPTWTRNYQVKMALCFHPKTPIQSSMGLIKFLNLRDLVKLTKDKNAPGPLVKASKQLLSLKRK